MMVRMFQMSEPQQAPVIYWTVCSSSAALKLICTCTVCVCLYFAKMCYTHKITKNGQQSHCKNVFIFIKEQLSVICLFVCVCVCGVCVWGVCVWGVGVPTKMAISKIIVLVGTFFGPHEESLWIMLTDVF